MRPGGWPSEVVVKDAGHKRAGGHNDISDIQASRRPGALEGYGPAMSKWNFVAMGQVGLTGWRKQVAQPVARAIASRTGRSEPEILALIGAGFLMIAVVDFLRTVDDVVAAGRAGPPRPDDRMQPRLVKQSA